MNKIVTAIAMCMCTYSFADVYTWDPPNTPGEHDMSLGTSWAGNPPQGPGPSDDIIFDGTNDGKAKLTRNLNVHSFQIKAGYTGTIRLGNDLTIGKANEFVVNTWESGIIQIDDFARLTISESDVLILKGANIVDDFNGNHKAELVIDVNSELHTNRKTSGTSINAAIEIRADATFEIDTGEQMVSLDNYPIEFMGSNGKLYINVDTSSAVGPAAVLQTKEIIDTGAMTGSELVLKNAAGSSGFAAKIQGDVYLDSVKVVHELGGWHFADDFYIDKGLDLKGEGYMECPVAFDIEGPINVMYAAQDVFHMDGTGRLDGDLTFSEPTNPSTSSDRLLMWFGDVIFDSGTLTVREYFDATYSTFSRFQVSGTLTLDPSNSDFRYRHHGTLQSEIGKAEFILAEGGINNQFANYLNTAGNPLVTTHDYSIEDLGPPYGAVFSTEVLPPSP